MPKSTLQCVIELAETLVSMSSPKLLEDCKDIDLAKLQLWIW